MRDRDVLLSESPHLLLIRKKGEEKFLFRFKGQFSHDFPDDVKTKYLSFPFHDVNIMKT